jgi:hypothetical protein
MEGAYSVQYQAAPARDGYVYLWRLVNLPAKECTRVNWQDEEFSCIHAIRSTDQDGTPLAELYDHRQMTITHLQATYSRQLLPWPIDGTLRIDSILEEPPLPEHPETRGKRGAGAGPKSSARRKEDKGALS